MEQITLAEAYRRRDSIAAASQAMYCQGGYTGVSHRLVFAVRQPGGVWYNVWLATDAEADLVAMHADAPVYLAEVPADQVVTISYDGRNLPKTA